MDDRERRLAENETLFREVNEHAGDVRAHANAHGVVDGGLRIVCECGRAECSESLGIARTSYEAVRAEPARFIVLPGHETEEVERVVERHEGYNVVEKTGESRAYVTRLDPRSR